MPTTRQGDNVVMTLEAVQAMIDQTLLRNNTTDDGSQNSGGGPRRPMQPAQRQAENKRKLDNNNQAQQQLLKKQNVYAVGTGEKKPYGGSKPLCPKYNYHHDGECAPKCTNCKKTGHLAKDCWHPIKANNQKTITCYECGNQGHYRSDFSMLKN
nr:hypothetical protein [Tanacetum cinerariifolium]